MRIALLVLVVLALSASVAMATGLNQGTQLWTLTYSEANGGPGTWSGIYDTTHGWGSETATGNGANLTVSADVELFAIQTWDNTGVYFHKADTSTPPPVVLNGTLTGNHGEWIGLEAKNEHNVSLPINLLSRVANYRLTAVTKGDYTIPLVWEMRDSVGSGYSAWKAPEATDTMGADGTLHAAYWWLLGNGTPGTTAGAAGAYLYQFQCTAQMTQLQQDGRYELDPTIVVSPEL
jgi:hypothetical protein